MLLERREFLGVLAIAAVGRAHPVARPALRIVMAGGGEAARRGAAMAVEESQRAAAMFGGAIGLGAPMENAAAGSILVAVDDVQFILGGMPSAGCQREAFRVAPTGNALAWHPRLTRFGAGSLNKRFRAAYSAEMTGAAWSAWFAVKCVWESALRSRASDARALMAHLEQQATRFDGHKGVPLYFDAAHRLVHPVYDADGIEIEPAPTSEQCSWGS